MVNGWLGPLIGTPIVTLAQTQGTSCWGLLARKAADPQAEPERPNLKAMGKQGFDLSAGSQGSC